ncbi:MAG: ribosomal-processing cysteine protease Prp [Lachnospiraceae bacterium]|nr:ribosomal-processing cysteine protease Prp [Ruminococcus sp.]MCM1273803.1 ribosomal-processing cysteine protease Prp [Lachnospiraceae bacterium]
MLNCVFRLRKFGNAEALSGFEISGHAGYGKARSEKDGNDIVCAAVSSCTMLVCNAVTENFGADADVKVEENRITLRLNERSEAAEQLISAFCEHLGELSREYGKIRLTIN